MPTIFTVDRASRAADHGLHHGVGARPASATLAGLGRLQAGPVLPLHGASLGVRRRGSRVRRTPRRRRPARRPGRRGTPREAPWLSMIWPARAAPGATPATSAVSHDRHALGQPRPRDGLLDQGQARRSTVGAIANPATNSQTAHHRHRPDQAQRDHRDEHPDRTPPQPGGGPIRHCTMPVITPGDQAARPPRGQQQPGVPRGAARPWRTRRWSPRPRRTACRERARRRRPGPSHRQAEPLRRVPRTRGAGTGAVERWAAKNKVPPCRRRSRARARRRGATRWRGP